MSLQRVALVTGGTRGIGAAISEMLAAAGVHVAAAFVSDTKAAAGVAERIRAAGGSVSLHQGDISDADVCARLVAEVLEQHGRVDHLINNAGALLELSLQDTTSARWQALIDVNLSSAFHLTRAALPGMIERGFGRIVYVSSVTAVMGSPTEAAYGAAKAGLIGLTRSVAREVARRGVTVNCVIPGVFETHMTTSMPVKTQESIRRMIPLGRRGDPAELAHAVRFLLDEQASYITGSVVTVDGGLSMGG
jgi:NAD(P)-dependent dehydrogenase (short-subunit alcohol dehydrogenase family)